MEGVVGMVVVGDVRERPLFFKDLNYLHYYLDYSYEYQSSGKPVQCLLIFFI